MFILAVFGVLVATALTSVVVRYIIEPDWEWANALTLGAILSATDPVAVVSCHLASLPVADDTRSPS